MSMDDCEYFFITLVNTYCHKDKPKLMPKQYKLLRIEELLACGFI